MKYRRKRKGPELDGQMVVMMSAEFVRLVLIALAIALVTISFESAKSAKANLIDSLRSE